ncbi:MAG: flagellar hook-associated protein FlgK [Phycisphaerae bacterium]|nr:flagellar hook-associated protein FlgK [Phycisphaerae bacterium]
MALINGSLQIGRTALTASQAALTVTGNNLANAATPGYSRQMPKLAPTQYVQVAPGVYTGSGVALYDVQRMYSESLNGRIRDSVGDAASYLAQQQAMERVEASFNELTEQDLSTRLNNYFGAWSALQTQPDDMASRNVVLQTSSSLSAFVRELRTELYDIQTDLDTQLQTEIAEANQLASEIADLNEQITVTEAGNTGAAPSLRDRRDEVLQELSELVNITAREVEGGSVNVFIGNEPLIQYAESRGLEYREKLNDDNVMITDVIFSDKTDVCDINSGKINGLIEARDNMVGSTISDLDQWASALIFETNKLHSLGTSMNHSNSVEATYAVDDMDASLADMDATGLNWEADNGVFYVNLYDSDGNETGTAQQVKIDIGMGGADTSLNSLAAQINGLSGVDASIDPTGRLKISASASDQTIGFSSPSDADGGANILAALGINSFFDGSNASEFQVSSVVKGNPDLIAADSRNSMGNGTVAGAIADLADNGVVSLKGVSLVDQLNTMITEVATKTRQVQDTYSAADTVSQTLEIQRQSIAGVSIDDEAMNMIIYQRAFQGASRYINLIDQMLDEVMNLI